MRYLFMAALAAAFFSPAAAETAAEAPQDAEQVSRSLIENVDAWLGTLNDKLQSDKPITEEDFDSMFGDSFLSVSDDPAGEVERAENHLGEKLDRNAQASETYGRWLNKRLPADDFSPKLVRASRQVSVDFRKPSDCTGAPRVKVRRGRIHLDYARKASGGQRTARRRYCVMAVPTDADQDKFRVKQRKNGVSVIFERLADGRKKTEAAK